MLTKLHDTFLPSLNNIATPCSTLPDQPNILLREHQNFFAFTDGYLTLLGYSVAKTRMHLAHNNVAVHATKAQKY